MACFVLGAGTSRRHRNRPSVGAVYARYSSEFQHSTEDQIRRCRELAAAKGIQVPDEYVFIDEAVTGRRRRREGYQALLKALASGKVGAVVLMATSRIHRRLYKALQFANEEVVSQGIRFLTVAKSIDSDEGDRWETLLQVYGIVDEMQATMYRENIRAAHEGLLLGRKVFGTIAFGYAGQEIEGEYLRNGKPRRRIVTQPDVAAWVLKVFRWYVNDRLPRAEIIRRLNMAGAPLPPRAMTGRWTDLAVRTLLKNTRYRGLWKYGETESVWLDKQDYCRQFKLDEPRKSVQIEDLRIVDDATWYKAQELAANCKHNAGRKPKDAEGQCRPRVLNGILTCAHHRRSLISGGGYNRTWLCPICRDTDKQLFTYLDRRLATEMVCRKIAELIEADGDLVARAIAACKDACDRLQRPDGKELEQLRGQAKAITKRIGVAQSYAVETDEDIRENQRMVGELRKQRAAHRAEIARLEAAMADPLEVPTEEEVRAEMKQLGRILLLAASSSDPSVVGKVRRVIETVTGGQIFVEQAGERKRGKGWLRGSFKARVLRLVAGRFGVADVDDDGVEVTIDFRRPPVHEQIADQVKALWDEGLMYMQIAERVGWNRNIVAKALAHWHEGRGLPAPDGRKHVKRLNRPKLAERIADQVMALVDKRMPIKDIAVELGVSRNCVTRAIRMWHERRGLPVPDGRALRKLRNRRKRDSA